MLIMWRSGPGRSESSSGLNRSVDRLTLNEKHYANAGGAIPTRDKKGVEAVAPSMSAFSRPSLGRCEFLSALLQGARGTVSDQRRKKVVVQQQQQQQHGPRMPRAYLAHTCCSLVSRFAGVWTWAWVWAWACSFCRVEAVAPSMSPFSRPSLGRYEFLSALLQGARGYGCWDAWLPEDFSVEPNWDA